jgi:phosphate transport system permease protein
MNEQPLSSSAPSNAAKRDRVGRVGQAFFFASTLVGLLALLLLLYNIVDAAFGLVAVDFNVDPATLSDRPLEELTKEELVPIVEGNVNRNALRALNRDAGRPFGADLTFAQLLEPWSQEEVYTYVQSNIVAEKIEESYSLSRSLTDRDAIQAEVTADYPNARLEWRSWLTGQFLVTPMSSTPWLAGVRTALLGSVLMIVLTMAVAIPVGVGAAIYLEEYATSSNWFERIIQTNINNLAGVPSIIYGMLGLAIFVRAMEGLTSGAAFGITGQNGKTVLSAALTMALLVLPILIISSQEAIRAVPRSLRLASFGLGATKWETVWHHVLPSAFPSILTGTILAMSRAIGETAPLIVVGASTFIINDPNLFSGFTILPIQIYNWTAQPQAEFRNIAAAGILVLLILLLSLNATAIFLRNRFQTRL